MAANGAAPKFSVGDAVMVTSVNRGRSYEGTVVKVGRKLVTVANTFGQTDTFRIDTGSKNDAYHHESVWTLDEYADREARSEQQRRLMALGARFDYGFMASITTDGLRRVADLLDELTSAKGL